MKRNSALTLSLNKWPLFLIGILVTVLVTCFGISLVCKPKEHERIGAFAPVYSANVNVFKEEAFKAAGENIREINLTHGVPGEDNTYRLFGAYYDSVDFYILPYSWLEKINTICAHFNKETINELIPNSSSFDLLSDDDNYYAIKIFNKDTDEGAMKNIFTYYNQTSEKEDYYITFRNKSVHLGKLNNSSSDSALKVVDHFLTL